MLTYAVVVGAAMMWLPHEWDWAVFERLSASHRPAFSPQVAIVDLPWKPADVAQNRQRIATLLDRLTLSDKRPSAVILDVEFDPCQTKPCGQPMEFARSKLVASLRAATRRFPVYATAEPPVDRNDDVSGPIPAHDAAIYGALTAAAQTRITVLPHSEGLFYRACYAGVPFVAEDGSVQGRENLWAMVDRVLMPPGYAARAACDASHLPISLGPRLAHDGQSIVATTADGVPAGADLSNKYVIVGTIAYDRSPFSDRSGPELLGWALSNALDRGSPISIQTYFDTRPQNTTLIVLVPAFSGLSVVVFAATFSYVKRARLRRLRRALPWLCAAIAACAGLATFGAFEAWMFHSHEIQPQVSLISLGIVLASVLSGVAAKQALFDEENTIDASPSETHDFDVFISYAREDGAWVFEHVYAPLRDAVLPDGKKLSVFFDTASIRAGTSWQDEISLAIDGSRFVVPVYTEQYFTKPYCRFEIRRAHRKWIAAESGSRCVLPVMRGHPRIDPTVDDIQALSVDDRPGLVQEHVAEIVQHLCGHAGA